MLTVAARPLLASGRALPTERRALPVGIPGPADGPWQVLRARARAATAGLPGVPEPGPGVCACCRGPARAGFARCFLCGLHAECAPGMLADVVAPAACVPKGSGLARDLWLYKSASAGAWEAGAALLALLLVFLHDESERLWGRAGIAGPTHACVVPSGRGRPGPHPLRALVADRLALPWAELLAAPGGPWSRDIDPGRFRARSRLTGAAILLVDDTWTTGSSAQSAAIALKGAGARSVAAVVLGRHLPPAAPMPRAPGRVVNRLGG